MNTDNIYIINAPTKFWGLTSVLVPSLELFNQNIKNNLKPIKEVLKPEELENFEVYGFEQNITGETKLPGEWNYCKIGDNYYHLEKTKSDGRFTEDGKEYFFYSVIYDDWASDFLINGVRVIGTISKTGDREKVEQNLIQTIPMVTDLNDRLDFDSHSEVDANLWDIKKPLESFYKKNTFTHIHPLALDWFNNKLDSLRNRGSQIYTDEKLIFPIYIQESEMGNGKIGVINNLIEYIYKGLAIFDVDKTKIHWSNYIAMYPSDLVVTLSNIDMETKQISKTINVSRWIKEINLEGLQDIQELNADFTEVGQTKKLKDLANDIVNRHSSRIASSIDRDSLKDAIFKDLIKYSAEMGDRLFISTGQYGPNFNGILNTEQRRELGIHENIEVSYDPPGSWIINGKLTNIREMQWEQKLAPFELLMFHTKFFNGIIKRNVQINDNEGYFYTVRNNVDLKSDFIFLPIRFYLKGDQCKDNEIKQNIDKVQLLYNPMDITYFKSQLSPFDKKTDTRHNFLITGSIVNLIAVKDFIKIQNLKKEDSVEGITFNNFYKLNPKHELSLEDAVFFPVGIYKPFNLEDNTKINTKKLFSLFHLAVHKFKSNTEVITNFKNGIVLMPDHDNHGFVPGILRKQIINLNNFDIRNGVYPDLRPDYDFTSPVICGKNITDSNFLPAVLDSTKINEDSLKFTNDNLFKNPHISDEQTKTRLKITELLTDNKTKKWNINTPSEKILEDSRFDRMHDEVKKCYLLKMILQGKKGTIGFKPLYNAYMPNPRDYAHLGDGPWAATYKLAQLNGLWDGIITLPANTAIDIEKIFKEFSDLPDTVFVGHNTRTGNSKGGPKDDDDVLCYDGSRDGFTRYKKLNTLPEKIRKNIIRIYLDPEGRRGFSEDQKDKLKKLCLTIYELFFREIGSAGINYRCKAIFGDIVGKKSTSKNLQWFSMSHFRPFNDFGFVSQIAINQEQTKGRVRGKEVNFDLNADGKRPDGTNLFFRFFKNDEEFWGMTNDNQGRGKMDDKKRDDLMYVAMGNGYSNYTHLLDGYYTEAHPYGKDHDGDGSVSSNARNGFYDIQKRFKEIMDIPKITIRTLQKESTTVTSNINLNPSNFDLIRDLNGSQNVDEKMETNWTDNMNFDIPMFLGKYLDPSQPVSEFHAMSFNGITSFNETRNIIRTKIKKAFRDLHVNIANDPIYFDLKGTDLLLCAKYNAVRKGLFEIMVKNPHNVLKEAGTKKIVFDNNVADVPGESLEMIINSTNELNIYGHKIPIKDRFKLDGNNIDLNVHVVHLEDKFQSASQGYYVNVDSPHSNILTQIEVPKETAITANMSVMDKRQLHQSFIYNSAERFYEKANYQIEKDKYFAEINMEQKYADIKNQQGIFGLVSRGLSSLVSVAQSALMGGAMTKSPIGAGVGAAIGGAQAVGNIISDVGSYTTGWSEEQEKRQFRRQLGIQMFGLKDEAMMTKHIEGERLDRLVIQNATSANTYPTTNNALIYRSFNQALGRTNIYLTQYRPKGQLLDKLKHYYKEYGFDILLTDQRVTGIESIKKHIKFVSIQTNQNENSTVRTMIETRLLTGVKIVEE